MVPDDGAGDVHLVQHVDHVLALRHLREDARVEGVAAKRGDGVKVPVALEALREAGRPPAGLLLVLPNFVHIVEVQDAQVALRLALDRREV